MLTLFVTCLLSAPQQTANYFTPNTSGSSFYQKANKSFVEKQPQANQEIEEVINPNPPKTDELQMFILGFWTYLQVLTEGMLWPSSWLVVFILIFYLLLACKS